MARADSLSSKIEGKESTVRLATMSGPGSLWRYHIWGKPYVDVNFALKASILIAESVFSPKSCPELQEELEHIHRECEEKLKETEQAFASSVMKSIEKRNEFENRKRKNGILQTIKNGILTVSIKRYSFEAKRKFGKYRQKKHLKVVLEKYAETIENIVVPHSYWYHYDVPKVDLDSVERELLSIKEASEHLRISEKEIRELITENEISSYRFDKEELVRKSELVSHIQD